MSLSTTPLRVARGRDFVLHSPALQVDRGEILAVLGPNGAGKSTFLQLLAGQLRPDAGSVRWEGRERAELGRREWARRVAFVAQEGGTIPPLPLEQYVRLGRIPFRGLLRPFTAQDEAAVTSALERCGLAELSAVRLDELSGGQRQRARIARALAQEPGVLLLDEPTNHLDLAVTRGTAHLLRGLAATGVALVMSVHDLDFAAVLSERTVLLAHGRVHTIDATETVLDARTIRRHWGVDVLEFHDGRTRRHVLDYGLGDGAAARRER